ncbi:MAG TPA: response regulator transcription factor [Candidatus Angelobacter sp.]|nr:response regulator transcription factor [Candidatus Angelobacter sp.]
MSKPKRHQPAEKSVRVLICAASSFARAELERLLEPESSLQVVGAVPNTNSLRPAIAESDPDVLFLQIDGQLQEMRWEELIVLGVPIVLLAESVDLVGAAAAIAGGVQGIVVGDVTGAELAATATSAAAGLLTLSSDLADLVRQGLLAHSSEDADSYAPDLAHVLDDFPEHLTLREREVLEMMSEGLSNKEIAAQLNISAHTVKYHVSSILGKLGASSRTEATTIGLRRGLITI